MFIDSLLSKKEFRCLRDRSPTSQLGITNTLFPFFLILFFSYFLNEDVTVHFHRLRAVIEPKFHTREI